MGENYKTEQELKYKELAEEIVGTMPDYIRSYKLNLGSSMSNNTKLSYLRDIKFFFDFIIDCFDDKGVLLSSYKDITLDVIASIDSEFIDEYFEYIGEYQKGKKTVRNSNVTKRRKLSSIRSLFAYLYQENKIPSNPTTKVRTPKVTQDPIIRLDNEESLDFINNVETGDLLKGKARAYHKKLKNRDLAINMVLLSTGIRVSELVGLNKSDLDLKHSSLNITRKGNKKGIVYFSDEAKDALEMYLIERNKMMPDEGHEDALFISSKNRRITVRSVELLVKKYAASVTPEKITPHKLRSTFATDLYRATNDAYLVSSKLGHSSIETVKRYSDVSDQRNRETRDILSYRKRD